MRGIDDRQDGMFSYVSLDARVPENHPLRPIRTLFDEALAKLTAKFDTMYAEVGRPSIAPERLLRASLLQVLYSVRSERLLCEQLDYNLLFRWFVGLSADERVFDHSSFSKNRDRLLEADIARALFAEVYATAQRQHLTSDEHFSVDGTLIDAWASQKSYRRKDGGDDDHPDGVGRNAGRNFHGEKRSNETHESRTDPQARMYRKSHAHPAKLCHSGQVLMENRNGLVAAACVVPRDRPGRAGHGDSDARRAARRPIASRSVSIKAMTPRGSSNRRASSMSRRMWRRITRAAAALRWTGAPLATPPIRSASASANALRNVLAGAKLSAACARPNFAGPTKSTFTSS